MADVETQILNQVTQSVGNAASTLYMVLMYVGIGAVVIGITWFILDYISYNIKVRVRVVAKNRKIIIDDRAKIVNDKEDGVRYLRLRARRHNIPLPPAESIEVDNKGKYNIEVYYTDSEEYQYVIDKLDEKELQEKGMYLTHKKNKKGKDITSGKYVYLSDTTENIQAFQPLTTNQRLILINQYKKAYARKTFKWTEHIGTIASVAALVIIFICLLVFWEDLTKPSLQAMSTSAAIQKDQKEIITALRDIYLNRQTIGANQTITQGLTPTPP
jgi:hypothetical protein